MFLPRKHESRLKNVPSKSPYTLPGPRPGNTPPHRRRASLSSRPASRRPSREMIQKSFHRIFTRSRAFTRRPRRPRRQLPRFSSLVLHVFARGDVLPDHDSRPRSFVRSLGTTRATARTNPRLARAFTSPLDGPSSSARARVPRPGTRASFPSNPAPRPVTGARRSLFPEILRRFSRFFPRFCDAFSRFIVLYRDETRLKLVPILCMSRKPRNKNQDLYKNKFTLFYLLTQATGQGDIMHTSESTPRPRLRTPGTLVQDEHS